MKANHVISGLFLGGMLMMGTPLADAQQMSYPQIRRTIRQESREILRDRRELRADCRELRRDFSNGASPSEIRLDRRELRRDSRELRLDLRERRRLRRTI